MRLPVLRHGQVAAHALVDDERVDLLAHTWRLSARGYVYRAHHLFLHHEVAHHALIGLRSALGIRAERKSA